MILEIYNPNDGQYHLYYANEKHTLCLEEMGEDWVSEPSSGEYSPCYACYRLDDGHAITGHEAVEHDHARR